MSTTATQRGLRAAKILGAMATYAGTDAALQPYSRTLILLPAVRAMLSITEAVVSLSDT